MWPRRWKKGFLSRWKENRRWLFLFIFWNISQNWHWSRRSLYQPCSSNKRIQSSLKQKIIPARRREVLFVGHVIKKEKEQRRKFRTRKTIETGAVKWTTTTVKTVKYFTRVCLRRKNYVHLLGLWSYRHGTVIYRRPHSSRDLFKAQTAYPAYSLSAWLTSNYTESNEKLLFTPL